MVLSVSINKLFNPNYLGVGFMVTKGILKNVDIKDKKMGSAIVSALENASNKRGKEVVLNHGFREVKGIKIKHIFEDK